MFYPHCLFSSNLVAVTFFSSTNHHLSLDRLLDGLEEFFDDAVGIDAVALGGEAGDEAVTKDGRGDGADVLGRDVYPAVK